MGSRRVVVVQNGHLSPSGIARGLGLAGQYVAEGGPLATVEGH